MDPHPFKESCVGHKGVEGKQVNAGGFGQILFPVFDKCLVLDGQLEKDGKGEEGSLEGPDHGGGRLYAPDWLKSFQRRAKRD